MGNQMQKGISDTSSFEIDNFSEKKARINSPKFLSSGCEWYVQVHPKEYDFDDYIRLYLSVHNPGSLKNGWKRTARYRFYLLNESGKVLYKGPERTSMFCAQFPGWGRKTLSLSKLKEEGGLENDKLIVKVEVKVFEIIHEEVETGKEMFNIRGFEVLYSQVVSVNRLFTKHPDIAVDFKPKSKEVKTAYMNLLFSLIEKLRKPPQSFSETGLNNAYIEFSELTEAGFKLDWLKKKLEDISLERKNAIDEASRVKENEERIKNLEVTLSDLKAEVKSEKAKSATAATKIVSFEDIL